MEIPRKASESLFEYEQSEALLEPIDDDVSCPICLEILFMPITNTCGHSYC